MVMMMMMMMVVVVVVVVVVKPPTDDVMLTSQSNRLEASNPRPIMITNQHNDCVGRLVVSVMDCNTIMGRQP